MRVWVDLANSPHVPLLEPIVTRLRVDGHDVFLTARYHAQTVELAQRRWPEVVVIDGESPPGRGAKARAIARRAASLRRFARDCRPDVAFSHGSYAQICAARASGVPPVTMMDYEHQPANHLSFRLARSVIVPSVFPDEALRRFGARPAKVIRYPGFKEELYLAGFRPDARVLDELTLDAEQVIAVFRPPPDGALYHRAANPRFSEVLRAAVAHDYVQAVLLPRSAVQARRYGSIAPAVRVPDRAIDASSLLALADLTVGAGGTMNRESAILGTPTYTVFLGQLAAVDAELMRVGRLRDLRAPGSRPVFEKKQATAPVGPSRSEPILLAVISALRRAAADGPDARPGRSARGFLSRLRRAPRRA